MAGKKYCMIEKELLANLIGTLKQLDVRGYDSMNMLVGCVAMLSQAYENGMIGVQRLELQQAPAETPEGEPAEEEG